MKATKESRVLQNLAVAALFVGAALALGVFALTKHPGEARKATILYMADLHAQLLEHPEMFWRPGNESHPDVARAGGLARIAQAVKDIRAGNPSSALFLDAGDTIQGSGVAAWTQGEVLVPILNKIGITLGVPGNWEVVYGTKVLRERSRDLNYPLYAANIRDAATGAKVFEPYSVREVNGLKVAIIAFTDPDVPKRQPPSFSAGFLYDGEGVLQGLIDKVRQEEKPDAVLLLTHIGLPKAVDLAGKVKGVDVILSADTHERTYEPIVKGDTWIVEPGAFGSFLGRLDLTRGPDGRLQKEWKLLELRADRYAEDPEIKALVMKQLKPYRERLDAKIGETSQNLARYAVAETTLDAVLADSLREAAGTEIALSNGFRFAYPILKGPVREEDLWNAYPITDRLKTGFITGQQLRDFWERELENVFASNPVKQFGGWLPRPAGMTLDFSLKEPAGKRVRSIIVGGKPLVNSQLYSIATCSREGDPLSTLCRIPDGIKVKQLSFDAHEAVRRYFKKHSPVGAPQMGRITIDGKPELIRSQYYLK